MLASKCRSEKWKNTWTEEIYASLISYLEIPIHTYTQMPTVCLLIKVLHNTKCVTGCCSNQICCNMITIAPLKGTVVLCSIVKLRNSDTLAPTPTVGTYSKSVGPLRWETKALTHHNASILVPDDMILFCLFSWTWNSHMTAELFLMGA